MSNFENPPESGKPKESVEVLQVDKTGIAWVLAKDSPEAMVAQRAMELIATGDIDLAETDPAPPMSPDIIVFADPTTGLLVSYNPNDLKK